MKQLLYVTIVIGMAFSSRAMDNVVIPVSLETDLIAAMEGEEKTFGNGTRGISVNPAYRPIDLTIIITLIKEGAPINTTDRWGTTPLMVCASRGDVESVKCLIKQGADVQAKNKKKTTALMMAVTQGTYEVVELLLDSGAEVNHKNVWGQTTLALADKHANKDIYKLLLEKGASRDELNKGLIDAIMNNESLETIESWIAKGAEVNARAIHRCKGDHYYNATGLYIACSNNNLKVVAFLLEQGADIDAQSTRQQLTPLMYTLTFLPVKKELCKLLITSGADLERGDSEGGKPLMYAKDAEIYELLIERGAKVNATDKLFGRTALMSAGGLERCIFLIEHGADIDGADTIGRTVLMHAAGRGETQVCAFLIENRAKVNAAAKAGYTALIRAARSGHHETCKFLLESGADPRAKAKADGNKPALIYALENEHLTTCKVLLPWIIMLPPVEEQELDEARVILKTLVCCYHLSDMQEYPKYTLYECCIKAFQDELFPLLLKLAKQGSVLPYPLRKVLTTWLTSHTLENINPILLKLKEHAKGWELKELLNPGSFEQKFGEDIAKSIKASLERGKLYATDLPSEGNSNE